MMTLMTMMMRRRRKRSGHEHDAANQHDGDGDGDGFGDDDGGDDDDAAAAAAEADADADDDVHAAADDDHHFCYYDGNNYYCHSRKRPPRMALGQRLTILGHAEPSGFLRSKDKLWICRILRVGVGESWKLGARDNWVQGRYVSALEADIGLI